MSDTTPRRSKRFQIEIVKDRVLQETVFEKRKDEETGAITMHRIDRERVVKGDSYNVYFPAGHSIWVETKQDLQRLGLTPDANYEIDLDTGLPVVPPKQVDLKERVERATRSPNRQG